MNKVSSYKQDKLFSKEHKQFLILYKNDEGILIRRYIPIIKNKQFKLENTLLNRLKGWYQ